MGLHLERTGDGPPLVLVHGTGSELGAWSRIVDRLAAHHEVVAVDLPGFGRSAPLGVPPTPAALADAVAGAIDELDLGPVHAVGHSLGGLVALELAAEDRARSVVSVCPPGMAGHAEWAYARGVLRGLRGLGHVVRPALQPLARNTVARSVVLAPLFARPWAVDPDELLRASDAFLDSPAFGDAIAATPRRMSPERIAAITCPVRFVWGRRDLLLFPWQVRRWHAALPAADVRMLAGAGHVPMTDRPAAVAAEILDFVAQVP